MKKKTFVVEKNGKLAALIAEQGFSYNYANKILRNKDAIVDGTRTRENIDIIAGSEITIYYAEESFDERFDKVYEDDNVLVLDKRAGIEVQGENSLEKLTGFKAVHRLDRNTSGIMIMSKNKNAENALLKAFKERTVEKKYIAEVFGSTNFKGEAYTAYLKKDSEKAYCEVCDKPRKGYEEIVTTFKTIKSNPSSSIVECVLGTGKTHQIRAHLAHLGHPIIGDGKYGRGEDNKKFKEKYQKLHAVSLRFKKLDEPLKYLENKIFEKYPSWLKIDN